MKNIIGRHVVIDYFDQDLQMKDLLPRNGTIVRSVKTVDWGDWYVLELEKPFDYFVATSTEDSPAQQLRATHLMVKPRAEASDGETHVFVILISDVSVLSQQPLFAKNLLFVCWGLLHVM